jgi:putative oxidoreductase
VHLKNGPWVTNQGYEYNLVLIAAVIALAETGPGSPSIDSAIGAKWHGPKWALRALVAGILGAIGAHIIAESAPAPEPVPDEAAAESNGGAAAQAESAQSA